MHENYHIFTSSSFCYASVMKQNGNPVILIIKKYIARIVKTLLKVKLQATSYNLTGLPERKFPHTFFPWISRKLLFSASFENVLKGYTAKLLYHRLRKHLNIRYLHVQCRVNILKKSKGLKEMSMLGSCFSNITIWIY